jgi:hypothetical protein
MSLFIASLRSARRAFQDRRSPLIRPDPPASSVQATLMSAPAQLDPPDCPKDQQLSMQAPPVKILPRFYSQTGLIVDSSTASPAVPSSSSAVSSSSSLIPVSSPNHHSTDDTTAGVVGVSPPAAGLIVALPRSSVVDANSAVAVSTRGIPGFRTPPFRQASLDIQLHFLWNRLKLLRGISPQAGLIVALPSSSVVDHAAPAVSIPDSSVLVPTILLPRYQASRLQTPVLLSDRLVCSLIVASNSSVASAPALVGPRCPGLFFSPCRSVLGCPPLTTASFSSLCSFTRLRAGDGGITLLFGSSSASHPLIVETMFLRSPDFWCGRQ